MAELIEEPEGFREFLQEYLDWVDIGAPQKKPFKKDDIKHQISCFLSLQNIKYQISNIIYLQNFL